jgi:uncharacterized membrane protein
MPVPANRLVRVHHFLARHGLYPILLSTLLAGGLFVTRVYLSQSWTFRFLVWNLFLAWIPYCSSLWAAHLHQRYPDRWWYLIAPGMLWLIFFPNAPYIVTDFQHLYHRIPIPLWYDIGLLTTFAWTGLYLAVFSLRSMQAIVRSFVGTVASWFFVLGVLGLTGLGVYVGRFLRWNSWDLLIRPREVLADVAMHLLNPLANPGVLGVTILFAGFMLVCYLTLVAVPPSEQRKLSSRRTPARIRDSAP